MTWRLPCGHTRRLAFFEPFPVYDRFCMRCHLTSKSTKEKS